MISPDAVSGIIAGLPEQPDRLSLAGRVQPGDQVAEPLGAADPGRVHERGQPEMFRAVGQPGGAQPAGVQPREPGPAVQGPDQRVRQVPAGRIGAAANQAVPGGPGRG